MNELQSTLSFEHYPLWYIGFCAAIGLAYALFLYFKDTTFKDATKGQRRMLFPLSILRFLVVSFIAFLLLSPLIKTKFTDVIQPYVVFIQDNSKSMAHGFEKTGMDQNAYQERINTLLTGLGDEFRVEPYSFSEKLEDSLSFNFDKKITNISQSLHEVYNNYSNQNVGAIILASDGIYNQGSNPTYTNAALDVPVYSIALGDTTPQRDLIVDKVLHNRIAYLDDKFTIRVDLSAKNCKGETTVLNVYKGEGTGNKVFSKSISVKKDNFLKTQDVILPARNPGVQQYSVRVTSIKDEVTTENNRQDVFIEVIDNRKKILLLGASPHPDMSAIKQSMELNKNYEITTAFIKDFSDKSVKGYNLAVLHGLPAKTNTAENIIQQLKSNQIPIWFIVSSQTSIPDLNQAQNILKINGTSGSMNDVKGEVKGGFNFFTVSSQLAPSIADFPPLVAPFGEYMTSATTQTLLRQRIGSVSTEYPLLVMQQATGYKTAVFTGEGLWRWRIYDFKKSRSHETINELISKTVQYLAVKNDQRKFRVNLGKTLYNENEQITFDAELYNDSYELINDPEVNLTIKNSAGKEFPFVFTKEGTGYILNAGFFPVGNYTYRAKTVFSGKEYSAKGKFSVAPIQIESLQLTANHQLLHDLSDKFGGEVVKVDSILAIANKIRNNPNIQPTLYTTYKTQAMINLKWLFYFILGFLAIEWFVRKFIGGY